MKDEALRSMPDGIRVIAEVIGLDATMRLVDNFGGSQNIYIPKKAIKTHAWARVLTEAQWQMVCSKFGGLRLNLPRGCFVHLKKQAIIALSEDAQLSAREIAQRVRCTERYVWDVLRDLNQRANQLKLFE